MPVCDDDQPAVYGVSENETVSVSCSVKSYPSAVIDHVSIIVVVVVFVVVVVSVVVVVELILSKVSFTWSFNNSLTSSLLPTNSYTQEAGTSTIT